MSILTTHSNSLLTSGKQAHASSGMAEGCRAGVAEKVVRGFSRHRVRTSLPAKAADYFSAPRSVRLIVPEKWYQTTLDGRLTRHLVPADSTDLADILDEELSRGSHHGIYLRALAAAEALM